jgi:hypothetical protein
LVSVRLLTPVSSGGALPERAAAQLHLLDFGRHIGLVEGADIGAGWHDLIDLVQDIIGKDDVHPGEQVVSCPRGPGR